MTMLTLCLWPKLSSSTFGRPLGQSPKLDSFMFGLVVPTSFKLNSITHMGIASVDGGLRNGKYIGRR